MMRRPSHAEVDVIRARAATGAGFPAEDVLTLLAFIDHQGLLLADHQQELREAGRELITMERELGRAEQAAQEARGWLVNYVCNVQIDGIPCGVTIPADEVGAALMQAHLLEAHDVPSKLPYRPTLEDREWARRQSRDTERGLGL